MAPSRQERHLMRQRGAGVREVKNANFGFTFGAAPLRPRSSSRRTPVPLEQRPSTRRTPVPLPPNRSTRNTPRPSSSRSSGRSRASARNITENEKAKPAEAARRDGIVTAVATPASRGAGSTKKAPERSRFVTPTTTGKRKRGRPSLKALQAIGEDELGQEDYKLASSTQKVPPVNSALSPASGSIVESILATLENLEPPPSQTGGKQRRDGVLEASALRRQSSTAHHVQEQDDEIDELQTPEGSNTARNTTVEDNSVPRAQSHASPITVVPGPQTIQESRSHKPAHAEAPSSKKRKRELRITHAKDVPTLDTHPENADSSDEDELSPVHKSVRPPEKQRPAAGSSQQADSQRSQPSVPQDRVMPRTKPAPGRKKQPLTRVPSQPLAPVTEEDEGAHTDGEVAEEQENANPKRSAGTMSRKPATGRDRPTKAGAKAPAKPSKSRTKAADKDKEKIDTKSTIPVTVYRLFNPMLAQPGAPNDDPMSAPAPSYTYRSGVNCVDVLAQVTSEIIADFAAARPTLQPDSTSSASSKRRRAYVRAYNAELSDRLFELTTTLDTNAILQKRVRAAAKEKAALRDDLLRLRRERDEVALRMDEVRARHAETSGEMRRKQELSTMAYDVELAVQRGKAHARASGKADEGPEKTLDVLLQDATRRVGGRDAGILHRVKRLNTVLERAAQFVEGRK